jgi:hypothetical protein
VTRKPTPGLDWEYFIEEVGDRWVAEFIGTIRLREEFDSRSEAEAWARGVIDGWPAADALEASL